MHEGRLSIAFQNYLKFYHVQHVASNGSVLIVTAPNQCLGGMHSNPVEA